MTKRQDPKVKKSPPEFVDELLISEAFAVTGSQRAAVATVRLYHEGITPTRRCRINPEKGAWLEYKRKVWDLTKKQPLRTIENYNLRAFKGWHLDHVLSVFEGFSRRLPPESIACMSNLRMMPARENIMKRTNTVFTNLFNE